MTKLLQRLHDELVRRHYATTTRESYLRIVKAFHRRSGGRLDRVGPDDLRRYQVYLLEERKLAVGTVVAEIAALRFFFLRVLKRRDMKEDLPYPKRRKRLPVVLSPEEVQRLIAGAKNLYHRTLLLTLYGAGLRRSEVAHLKVRDIDSQRMLLRVDQGKGGRDREVPLSPTLLLALREYYRWMRPRRISFPERGTAGVPISPSRPSRSGKPCGSRPSAPRSTSRSRRTRCDIPTRRICWKPAPTFARSSSCSATPTSRTPRSISTCRVATYRPPRIRWSSCRSRRPWSCRGRG